MNKEFQTNRFTVLFRMLQDEGEIDKNRKLIKSKFWRGISRDIYNIKFDENFLDEITPKLTDTQLIFILLHEEGHFNVKIPKRNNLFAIASLGVLFAPISSNILENVYPKNNFLITGLLWILILYLIISVFYRYSYSDKYQNEFKADKFASDRLKKKFNVNYPSNEVKVTLEVLSNAIDTIYGRNKIRNKICWGLIIFFGIYPSYHPSILERVNAIKESIDQVTS